MRIKWGVEQILAGLLEEGSGEEAKEGEGSEGENGEEV